MRDEAAAWVVRLSDPACTDTDRADFALWREHSAEHELAYERERFAWDRLDRLQALRPAASAPDPDLLVVKGPPPLRQRPTNKPIRWRWAAAACLAGAVAGVLAIDLSGGTAYATAVGERRVIVLPDRSRIELNTNSKVVVLFRGGTRKVKLVRGEAMFEIAKAAAPFEVLTGAAVITSNAAQFDVRLDSARTAVVVATGAATLRDASPSGARVALAPHAQGVYADGRSWFRPMSDDQLNQDLAWRQDDIDLTGRTLREAAAEFNRYNNRHIVISDPSIATLRLGGYFHTSDVDGFIRALTLTFPVSAQTRAPDEVTLTRRG